jgi:hypothetical protein
MLQEDTKRDAAEIDLRRTSAIKRPSLGVAEAQALPDRHEKTQSRLGAVESRT